METPTPQSMRSSEAQSESGDQADVIAFLSDPKTYAQTAPVERIDTHAAIIFLAGPKAYKLKRAVRYPYLDFSTAQKRKAVCDAELMLNRRTASEIYLGVECVGRDGSGNLVLGQGDPVDWLVVMRRFPADCLLDAVARNGKLAPTLIRNLADEISSFHSRAEIVTDGKGAERVRKVIEGNRASMAALEPGLLPVADCARLHAQSLAMLEDFTGLLDARAISGRVRHCHGDLHLANICLWNGQPTLFDCLEFDVELATTDVLYDLAFLIMDLWQRGFHSEASLLFNRYCDMGDECDGLILMPLFLSMRAAVRAHVEASAARRQKDDAGRQGKLCEAQRYLSAALAFLARPDPHLIAVGGLSGTGKSTLAGGLAPLIGPAPGARWLRTDVLRKRLAGTVPEDRLPPDAYSQARNAEVYQRLIDEARRTIGAAMPVIVDGVFADAAERQAITAIAGAAQVPFTGLWLEAPRDILHERVNARRGDASDADAAIVDRQLGYTLGDLSGWTRIPAQGTADEVLARAVAAIGKMH